MSERQTQNKNARGGKKNVHSLCGQVDLQLLDIYQIIFKLLF